MKFKKGVKLEGVCPEIVAVWHVAEGVYNRLGEELVITSVCEGKHGPNSLHYSGKATDLRTRVFKSEAYINEAASLIRKRLTDEYDVVVEATHIHVEFDPK
jgi:hypothetical protein